MRSPMAKLGTKEIRDAAKVLLKAHPSGLRFSELVKLLSHAHPDTNYNTIWTQVGSLPRDTKGAVVKPSRGVYQLASLADGQPLRPTLEPEPLRTFEQD